MGTDPDVVEADGAGDGTRVGGEVEAECAESAFDVERDDVDRVLDVIRRDGEGTRSRASVIQREHEAHRG